VVGVFGRRPRRRSHWLYRTDTALPMTQEKFTGLDDTVLVELRGTGGQTMAPPSVHPSGERLEWREFTEPSRVELAELRRAAGAVAAAALLARRWPRKGRRQDAALALAGALLRGRWEQDPVAHFVEAVAAAARDAQPQ